MDTITELKAKRAEIVEALIELDHDANKVEIHEMYGEISKIDRKIHAIDPSQV